MPWNDCHAESFSLYYWKYTDIGHKKPGDHVNPGDHVGTPLHGHPVIGDSKYGLKNQKYNATIGDATGWFKTMTTNEYIRGVKKYNWQRFNKKLRQRNYWEHIIRNEAEYNRIADYIIDNPANWDSDKLNPKQSWPV